LPFTGRTFPFEGGEYSFEALPDAVAFETEMAIEYRGAYFLGSSGGTGTASRCVAEVEDEAGRSRDGDRDLTGKVLGAVEGNESIDADILLAGSKGAKVVMEGQRLSGKSLESVLDGTTGCGKEAGKAAE